MVDLNGREFLQVLRVEKIMKNGPKRIQTPDRIGLRMIFRVPIPSEKNTWRIIPFSKWLITMVIVSPLTGVVPLINGLFMVYK